MKTAQRLLAGATLYALSIPFHERFRHSEADRAACDSVAVRVVDADGNEGWGEGAPRPYVTGETVTSMLADLAGAWPAIAATTLPRLEGPADLALLQAGPPGLRRGGPAGRRPSWRCSPASCAAVAARCRASCPPGDPPSATAAWSEPAAPSGPA